MSSAGCSYARFADVAHAVNEQKLNVTDYIARCDDACLTIFASAAPRKVDVSDFGAMIIYVIQFSMISFFGPLLPVLIHLLRSQKSRRMTQFTQSLYNLRGTAQRTQLFFSNALFIAAIWRVLENPPLLETAFIASLVQTQAMLSYQMSSSATYFSDLDLRAVEPTWQGRSAFSSIVQMAIGAYIAFRKGLIENATSHEAALACHNIRGTIDVSKIFAESSSSSTLFLWMGGIICIMIAFVLLAIYTSPGQRVWLSLKESWARIISKKGFHISLLVVSILTLLGMTINLFTARRQIQQFSGAQHDRQWKFAHLAAILWLPLFINIFKEFSGYHTALPSTEISDTIKEQKFHIQTTSDEKLEMAPLSALDSTGQQTMDQHFPKLDEGEERHQYASGITRRKDTEEMVGMTPSETARRRTSIE